MGPTKDIKVPPPFPSSNQFKKGLGGRATLPRTKISYQIIYACLAAPTPISNFLHLDFLPQLFHPSSIQPSPLDRVGVRAGKTEHESRFGVQSSHLPRPIESSEGGRDDRWIIEFEFSGGPSCFSTLDTKYQSTSRTIAGRLRLSFCPSVFDQGLYLQAFKSIGY